MSLAAGKTRSHKESNLAVWGGEVPGDSIFYQNLAWDAINKLVLCHDRSPIFF